MNKRKLGNTPLSVFEIGLGCMGMSEFYGNADEKESIATLHRALELGVNFYDTADMYGSGANEELLAKAFKNHWDKIIIATKFGIVREPHHPEKRTLNGSPAYVKKACDASLKRLGTDVIDLYYLHRWDKNVPIEDTVGAMADLVSAGKVKYLGLSEVSTETLQKAHQVHPITALQSEYSLWTRDPENKIIPLCESLHISFVAYSPLGRGFLTNKLSTRDHLEKNDYRLTNPRFDEENFPQNYQLVQHLNDLALGKKCSHAQLALAWVLAKSANIIPIPGTKRRHYLEENIKATEIKLTHDDIAQLDKIFAQDKIAGSRYTLEFMSLLDK